MTYYELIKKCETIDNLAIVLIELFDCPLKYVDCPTIPCRECLKLFLNEDVANRKVENLVLQ